MLRELGAEVLDADEAAHAVYAPGSPGFDAVVREFGTEYVLDGSIDRARLGQLVFNDAAARQRLNAIVHPLVREWMAARTAEAARRDARAVVVQEVPLLFENGLQRLYGQVVLVYVPEAVQVERLVGRGLSEDRARAIISSQMPIEEKRLLADHVIDNSGTEEETRGQVVTLWDLVLAE
jgi:dephospho-CoA kinase